ncbi:MAG: nucleotide exchange factor GrpE [Planctomycetaceae bacterium]
MNDSACDVGTPEDTSLGEDAPPEFGLVDVIEAFTAMRHEWRGQTRESRAAAESVQAAASAIQGLEARLLAHAAESSTDESRKLAELIVDVDHQLTRSIEAAVRSEAIRKRGADAETTAIRRYFESLSAVARWFARPLLTFVAERLEARDRTAGDPAIEGLNLVLARLRRSMKELHIERFEALGRPFDANTMNAIGTVESPRFPPGHVAEQLSPCYRWHGRLLRFADVRVAAPRSPGDDSPGNIE